MLRLAALLALTSLLAPRPAAAEEGSVIRVVPKGKGAARVEPSAEAAAPEAEVETTPPTGERSGAAPTAKTELAPLPRPRPAPRYVPAATAERDDDGPRVLPWVTLGASAALGVMGAVFASEATSALDGQEFALEVEGNRAIVTDEFRDAQNRVVDNTIISTALLSSAAAGALMSLILLIED